MNHWEQVYTDKSADTVSWYQPVPHTSLRMIADAALPDGAAIIDVGAGASNLVDHLLAQSRWTLGVLDLSARAIDTSRARLGDAAKGVQWMVGDLLDYPFANAAWDLWHDRAVFHFLTAADQRRRYVEQLRRTLRPGGQLILATFAEDGPERCSGLPVARYDASGLAQELGADFSLLDSCRELHHTPGGNAQSFVYTRFAMLPGHQRQADR